VWKIEVKFVCINSEVFMATKCKEIWAISHVDTGYQHSFYLVIGKDHIHDLILFLPCHEDIEGML
jgi:hypothetical protein